MRTELINPGISIRTSGATCEQLCQAVCSIPGITITRRNRRWSILSVLSAEFTFRGFQFTIEPDEWDGAYWIMSRDSQSHESEMLEIQAAVEAFVDYRVPNG